FRRVLFRSAEAKEFNFYYVDANTDSISVNETNSLADVNSVISIFAEVAGKSFEANTEFSQEALIPVKLERTSTFLEHDVFNTYNSESHLMRYIKKVERKDLSINHSIISMWSCTMKLNAAADMLPVSNSNWNNILPFAAADQTKGYLTMLHKLEQQLNVITGFAG